ncbi:MAG: Gfo/Idh/MocA family oxidoreductase [Paenibacillaceae bacterium]|nr:Gfo/Idh/MocA family oxidoreductase [Paenibacillaceae bacterium]
MIKAAVVGCNHIGNIHCRVLKAHPDVELTAVCDLMEDRAKTAAAAFGATAYTDLSRLLAETDVDVVHVATAGLENGSHHFAPAMLAIQAGKDVLVEKPISNDIEEARTLVREARARGVRLACNMNHRFVEPAYKAKEWIAQGKLGTLLFVNMKLTIRNKRDDTPWFHLRALHPHSIDVMRYFAGDIKRVQAFMTQAPGRTSWSTVSINMLFASGAVGHLTGSYDMSFKHPIESCEVAGDQGRFTIDNVYDKLVYYPHESEEKIVIDSSIMGPMNGFNDTLGNRIGHFIGQVKDRVAPELIAGSGVDALAAQEVIEAAIRSQQEGGAAIDVVESWLP